MSSRLIDMIDLCSSLKDEASTFLKSDHLENKNTAKRLVQELANLIKEIESFKQSKRNI